MSLIHDIEEASGIDGLTSVVACPKNETYYVSNRVCWLYFQLLEGNQVKLLGFRLAEDGRPLED